MPNYAEIEREVQRRINNPTPAEQVQDKIEAFHAQNINIMTEFYPDLVLALDEYYRSAEMKEAKRQGGMLCLHEIMKNHSQTVDEQYSRLLADIRAILAGGKDE
ncbi:hypothetical protein [Rodentibacter caecimuris]|uniref:hypothetical protein n=1 Tax=Rodentibacter caecimuris TaxID=1796644 RepID=UPI0013A0A544|nr:hypothetical protein [Rodentibacter heylii]QIA76052.1 hypothetical protein FEE42_01100 [Rodentibacter heylii]